MIKNVLCNKSNNAPVCFFICMSSICVQHFTAFEEEVLKLYVPWCKGIFFCKWQHCLNLSFLHLTVYFTIHCVVHY